MEQINTSNANQEPPVIPIGDQFTGTGHASKSTFDDLFM